MRTKFHKQILIFDHQNSNRTLFSLRKEKLKFFNSLVTMNYLKVQAKPCYLDKRTLNCTLLNDHELPCNSTRKLEALMSRHKPHILISIKNVIIRCNIGSKYFSYNYQKCKKNNRKQRGKSLFSSINCYNKAAKVLKQRTAQKRNNNIVNLRFSITFHLKGLLQRN